MCLVSLSIHLFELAGGASYQPQVFVTVFVLELFKKNNLKKVRTGFHKESAHPLQIKTHERRFFHGLLVPVSHIWLACGYTNGDLALCYGRLTIQ